MLPSGGRRLLSLGPALTSPQLRRRPPGALGAAGGAGSATRRWLSSSSSPTPDFGIFFDIDGVIVRGKNVLPFAPHAFKRLVDDKTGEFRVPTVFVTNACNTLRKKKADQLSAWLGIEVDEDQVVMSHSPLKMFNDYHDKHVLVIGQGPVDDIARNLGFKKVTTIKQLRHAFPTLDNVDHKRRRAAPCAFESYFPRIEAIVLFGEPIRWETSLQLLVDVLCTEGLPNRAPEVVPHPHLPVLACNMDLQWMAEAPMPRFGHGAFLLCLENLFKKVTQRDLIYTGLIGKPSEITYRHAEHVLQQQASLMTGNGSESSSAAPVSTIYCIGDNVCTDIFGANLYNRYLHHQRQHRRRREPRRAQASGGGGDSSSSASSGGGAQLTRSRSIEHLIGGGNSGNNSSDLLTGGGGGAAHFLSGAENCYSVLVETGVYSTDSKYTVTLDHSPRDFLPVQDSYSEPTFTVKNVYEAVDLIFKQENYE